MILPSIMERTSRNNSGVSRELRLRVLTSSSGVGATIELPRGVSEMVLVRSWVNDSFVRPYL